MAARRETSSSDDPDNSMSSATGYPGHSSCTSCHNLQTDEILSDDKSSQLLFNSPHESDPPVSQDSLSSFQQPFEPEASSSHDVRQTDEVTNVHESSRPLNHPLHGYISSSAQEAQQDPDPIQKIRLSKDQDGQSRTEFKTSQDAHSLQQGVHAQQHSVIEGTHPTNIQSSGTSKRKYPFDCHNVGEKRCYTTREMRSQSELITAECTETPGSYPPEQRSAERDANRNLGQDLLPHEQTGDDLIMSQGLDLNSYAKRPRLSSIGQTSCLRVHDTAENEVRTNQLMSSTIPLQNMIQSIANDHPYSTIPPIEIEMDESQGFQLDTNINKTPSPRTRRRMIKRWIANQVKDEACEIQKLPTSVPKSDAQSNTNNRPFPHSRSQLELKLWPYCIYHDECLPGQDPVRPFPVCCLAMGRKKLSPFSGQVPDIFDSKEYLGFNLPETPNLKPELVNVMVYGDWTNWLLQILSAGIQFDNKLIRFVLQRTFKRGPIERIVNVWQLVEYYRTQISSTFFCTTAKATMVIVLYDAKEVEFSTVGPLVSLVRKEIHQDVPIIVVGRKVNQDNQSDSERRNSKALTLLGYRLKARYNLAAYIECSVDSAEEAENVLLTAIDVSSIRS